MIDPFQNGTVRHAVSTSYFGTEHIPPSLAASQKGPALVTFFGRPILGMSSFRGRQLA